MSSDITQFDATKLPMMKIYDFPNGPIRPASVSPWPRKYLQSRVRFEMVDLYKGEHKKPAFIATKNYSGTLPVLELDDGTLIAECTAITEYLDGLYGVPTLTGRTAREKGLIHMMSKRAESGSASTPSAFTSTTPHRGLARTSRFIRTLRAIRN